MTNKSLCNNEQNEKRDSAAKSSALNKSVCNNERSEIRYSAAKLTESDLARKPALQAEIPISGAISRVGSSVSTTSGAINTQAASRKCFAVC
jgi:hypothetical protein